MQRHRVESSLIVSVGYDPKEQILELELTNKRIYRYFEVDPQTHRDLLEADSLGQYFNAFIRGDFPSVRMK